MAPTDYQSPSPAMPPPPTKRVSRAAQQPGAASGGSAGTGTGAAGPSTQSSIPGSGGANGAAGTSRAKRKKPDDGGAGVAGEGSARGAAARARGKGVGAAAEVASGAGDDDDGEVVEGEVVTKIDFRQLPSETLYKYLEQHELLPKWGVSPWSEDPVTQPHMLYSTQTRAPNNPTPPSGAHQLPDTSDRGASLAPGQADTKPAGLTGGAAEPGGGVQADDTDADAAAIAPTTRSKTAPFRKPTTPVNATPGPGAEDRTRVMTLSDVLAARDILAEKANAHWVKGLGGGQNRESETIVNFLYKMKVGPGRLLRVYNPAFPAESQT